MLIPTVLTTDLGSYRLQLQSCFLGFEPRCKENSTVFPEADVVHFYLPFNQSGISNSKFEGPLSF